MTAFRMNWKMSQWWWHSKMVPITWHSRLDWGTRQDIYNTFQKKFFFQTKKSSKEMRSLLLGLGIGHRQCWWLESIIGRWQIFKLACAHSYFDSGQQHLCRQSPFHRLILFMRWTRVEWSGHLLCIQSQMKFLWAKISDQNIFMKQRLDQPCPCEEKLVTSIILLPSALLPEI